MWLCWLTIFLISNPERFFSSLKKTSVLYLVKKFETFMVIFTSGRRRVFFKIIEENKKKLTLCQNNEKLTKIEYGPWFLCFSSFFSNLKNVYSFYRIYWHWRGAHTRARNVCFLNLLFSYSRKKNFHNASIENPIFGTCRAGWNYDFQP